MPTFTLVGQACCSISLKDVRKFQMNNLQNNRCCKHPHEHETHSFFLTLYFDFQVFRNCYGQHVGFKMFMDSILLSIARKVVMPDFELFVNLGDWPLMKLSQSNLFPMFSWCGSKETADIVMPTYEVTESSLQCMGRYAVWKNLYSYLWLYGSIVGN